MKQSSEDLAILGGEPAFKEQLHVGRPNIGNRERFIKRVEDILDRRWFTNDGPYVRELERRICEMLDVKHCVAMCNGTIALEIAIRALDLRGEVIVPSFTFVATAHALQWQEITAVFCDVAPGTHHLDPERIEEAITPRTTGIIGVHVWGETYGIEPIQAIAEKHNLRLLFDAAHAFGVAHNGRMIGSFGDAEVFSFHATKFFNTLEGGAITTNDDNLAEKMRFMRNFGFAGYDQTAHLGTNGKMNEISAAMGLTSFECLDEFVAVNRYNYETYRNQLASIPGLKLFQYNPDEKRNYQYVILEIDEAETGLSRNHLVEILHAENVLARRYFYPGCHQMEPYRSYYPFARLLLPETEALTQRVISLPSGTAVNQDAVRKVCNIIEVAIAYGHRITKELAAVRNGHLPAMVTEYPERSSSPMLRPDANSVAEGSKLYGPEQRQGATDAY